MKLISILLILITIQSSSAMSLRSEIDAWYTDKDGLVSPHPCLHTDVNASNNGLSYLSEYMTLLVLSRDFQKKIDTAHFNDVVMNSEVVPGCYNRSPSNLRDYGAVDDYYGISMANYFMRDGLIASEILTHGAHNWGSYNNINPFVFTWPTMMWRQPQLVAMMLWGSGRKVWFPLNVYVAVVLAFACRGKLQTDGADRWRLTWDLAMVASRESWLCRQASKLWLKRLFSIWGPDGMKAVYRKYYQGLAGQDHPFVNAVSKGLE